MRQGGGPPQKERVKQAQMRKKKLEYPQIKGKKRAERGGGNWRPASKDKKEEN